MTPTADLMKLVEAVEAARSYIGSERPDPKEDPEDAELWDNLTKAAAALSSTGEAQYPEDSDVSVSEDGTLHVDLCRDGSPKRQLSILVQKDGAVKFAIYCEGRRYHGSVNGPNFIAALADYSSTGEARVGGAYTVQWRDNGWTIYYGRTHEERGWNLGTLTETTAAFASKLQDALNATPAQPKASDGKAGGEVG